jgi:hypothetical protein
LLHLLRQIREGLGQAVHVHVHVAGVAHVVAEGHRERLPHRHALVDQAQERLHGVRPERGGQAVDHIGRQALDRLDHCGTSGRTFSGR